jgi:hypothetical protein
MAENCLGNCIKYGSDNILNTDKTGLYTGSQTLSNWLAEPGSPTTGVFVLPFLTEDGRRCSF